MERHVKQQHPELWSQRQRPPGGRRSNRGGRYSFKFPHFVTFKILCEHKKYF